MQYDAIDQRYHLSRYSVAGLNGMVCSSSNLASGAGLEILKKGGNAIDAAIATAAVLTVVEPVSNGLGGDAFAIVYLKDEDKLYGLNASGYSPKSLSIDAVKALNYNHMPKHGWLPVMVPGQPKAWAELSQKFGKLPLTEVLKPAINYALNGYPLSPVVAKLWQKYVLKNREEFAQSSIFNEWFRMFTKDGEPYKFGEVVKFPKLAKSLRIIGETNAKAFYEGEIAEKIVAQSKRDGGFIRMEDLRDYELEWVDPISVKYRGYDVYELPPNGQGIVTLMALNTLSNFDFAKKEDIYTYHHQFEAMKMAFEDAFKFVSDPKEMKEDYHKYLSPEYGRMKASLIKDEAYMPNDLEPARSGTVYLCTADKDGNMVSYIQSNYMDFGSGVVIEDYGIAMENRGFDFSLNPEAINALKGHKRSYHTIIPGFLCKDNKPIGPFGVMGGYMQPQGHVQVLMNYIDFHLNPQMCLDAPRWQWKKGKEFIVEPDFDKDMVKKLQNLGHIVNVAEDNLSFGRAEFITRLDSGIYVGATESRTDGSVAAY